MSAARWNCLVLAFLVWLSLIVLMLAGVPLPVWHTFWGAVSAVGVWILTGACLTGLVLLWPGKP